MRCVAIHGARRRQRGAGAVEFVVVFLLFMALLAGLFEMTRVFRSKHTLNAATFSAARAGALNGARLQPMNLELANDMAPLFHAGASSAGLAAAITRARAFAVALAAAGGGVDIVSPTQAVFDDLKKTQYFPVPGTDDLVRREVIPNDNLRWRPRRVADTPAGDINLQDANLLKIRSLWCHRLVVSGLDRAVFFILNLPIFATERQGVCSALTAVAGNEAVPQGFYIAIAADAIIRMQTPVVGDDLP